VLEDLEEMIGKRLLVGITYVGKRKRPDELTEFAGIVIEVDPLVAIDIGGDEPFTLPPSHGAYSVASPGIYTLRSTGEVVENPDFVATWTVQPPGKRR